MRALSLTSTIVRHWPEWRNTSLIPSWERVKLSRAYVHCYCTSLSYIYYTNWNSVIMYVSCWWALCIATFLIFQCWERWGQQISDLQLPQASRYTVTFFSLILDLLRKVDDLFELVKLIFGVLAIKPPARWESCSTLSEVSGSNPRESVHVGDGRSSRLV